MMLNHSVGDLCMVSVASFASAAGSPLDSEKRDGVQAVVGSAECAVSRSLGVICLHAACECCTLFTASKS